jgi:hypothetical protein
MHHHCQKKTATPFQIAKWSRLLRDCHRAQKLAMVRFMGGPIHYAIMNRILAALAVVALLLVPMGCGCTQRDVTDDPSFKFYSIQHHLFSTTRDIMIHERGGLLYIDLPKPDTGETLPLGTLSRGTLLRPQRLEGELCPSGGLVVLVTIETGRYAGRMATVETRALFLDPTSYAPAYQVSVSQWEGNPVYLTPVRD